MLELGGRARKTLSSHLGSEPMRNKGRRQNETKPPPLLPIQLTLEILSSLYGHPNTKLGSLPAFRLPWPALPTQQQILCMSHYGIEKQSRKCTACGQLSSQRAKDWAKITPAPFSLLRSPV